MSGLLMDTPLNDEQRELSRSIRVAGDSLLSIVNNVLDFSKLEGGHFELETGVFDAHAFITELADVMQSAAERKGIALLVEIVPNLPRWFLGDAGRIRQFLLNLISSGIKFIQYGAVTVKLAAVDRQEPATRLRFEVADTGISIPRERQGHIFQKSAQVDALISRRFGGTGLGLSIARQLVDVMGGSIGFDSEPGRGSRFGFVLPITQGVAPEPREAAVAGNKATSEMALRILVAEDNATNKGWRA